MRRLPSERQARLLVWLLMIAMLIAVCIVQGRALFFFFSADDLVHLQQAYGLIPTPTQPWRFLTQVLYFRAMALVVGPLPIVFIAVNLALHIVNVLLFTRIVRARGVSPATAALAGVLFGACPLLVIVVGHPVIINDISALTLTLLAIMLLERRSKASQGGAVLLFLGALGCKESVLFLPAVSLLDEGGKVRRDRRAALSIIGVLVALVAVSFFLARTRAAAPAGAAYAIELWPAPLENLMTYTRWCVSLHRALPDLVRSPDPAAYRVALPILVIIVWAGLASRSTHPAVLWGLAWWIFGLLPVLPLRNSTYPHYMYAALPGFMLAVAATLESLATKLWASNRGFSIQRAWPALAIVVVVCYTIRSQDLVSQRLSLRLEGSDLPLDPQIRSMEIAGRAVYSLRDSRWPAHTRLAILSPPGARRVWGARSGHEYALGDNGGAGYDLQRVVLSEGRALRVFFPQLDTVAYVPRWSRSLLGWAIAVPASGGTLAAYGSDAQSYRRLAGDLQQGPNQALAAEFADSLSAALGTE